MSDELVRQSFLRKHAYSCCNVVRQGMARIILKCLLYCNVLNPSMEDTILSTTSRYYRCVRFLTTTSSQREALRRYHKWSIQTALQQQQQQQDGYIVMHCPVPNCDYTWLANARYRKKKMANEAKYSSSSSTTTTSSSLSTSRVVKSFRRWLFYKPPAPEPCTRTWVEPECVDLTVPLPPTTGSRDGRRMTCAKCHSVFCGLCKRPWHGGSNRGFLHEGQACSSLPRSMPDFEYLEAATAGNAKSCPSCSIRTHRIDGCNHMQCPCGYHWCYACQSRWNQSHYSCIDHGLITTAASRRNAPPTAASSCIIS